jgi:plastocyanin
MEDIIMKKQDFSLSRLGSGIAFLVLIFSISNSCTKPSYDNSGSGATLGPSGYQVSIGDGFNAFNPLEIKVSAGDIVTWINNSPEIESVTSDQGLFDGILRNNESYSFKFTSAGTYTYFNRMHPGLNGKVVVK